MKKFMTYITAVLLFINMVFLPTVRAESGGLYVQAEIKNGCITISGGGCFSSVKNVSVKITDPHGNLVNLNQIRTEDDGTYTYSVALGENEESGNYTAAVMARGAAEAVYDTVYYLSRTTVKEIEDGINGAKSAVETKEFMQTEAENLSISGFTENQLNIAAEMLYNSAQVSKLDFDGIRTIAAKSEAVFAQLQSVSAVGITGLLTAEHNALLGNSDEYRQYLKFKAADRNSVNEALTAQRPFISVADFMDKFASAVKEKSGSIEKRLIFAEASKDGDNILISGKSGLSSSGAVTVKLSDPKGTVVNLNQIKTSDDGTFAYSVKIDSSAASGTYKAEIFGRGADEKTKCEVYYLSSGTRESIENEINKAVSAAAVKAVLKSYASEMELAEMTSDDMDNASVLLYEQKPSGGWNYSEVLDTITKALDLVTNLNTKDWTEADDYITENSAMLLYGISEYYSYSKMTEGQRGKICKDIMQSAPFKTIEAFRKAFKSAIPQSGGSSNTGTPAGGGGGGGGIGGGTNSFPVSAEVKPSENTEPAKPFEDLNGYEWAESYINDLYKASVISPAADKRFRPGDSITREEFIKLVVCAFKIQNNDAKCSFSDVNESDWFYSFVSSAYDKGIINGYEDGNFGVGRNITRQEIAAILHRAAQVCNISTDTAAEVKEFADSADIDSYAREATEALQSAGVINGDENGRFRPHDNAVRAEAAKMIAVMTKNVK